MEGRGEGRGLKGKGKGNRCSSSGIIGIILVDRVNYSVVSIDGYSVIE